MFCVLVQNLNHGGKRAIRIKKRVSFAKMMLTLTCLIAPSALVGGNLEFRSFLVTINLAVSTLLVLILHAISGGFRREVAKKTQIRLNGHLLAFIIARGWLMRARLRIQARIKERDLELGGSESHLLSQTQSPIVQSELAEMVPEVVPVPTPKKTTMTIITSAIDHAIFGSSHNLASTMNEQSPTNKSSARLFESANPLFGEDPVAMAKQHVSPMEAALLERR